MFDWNYWLDLFGARAYELEIKHPDAADRLGDDERRLIADSIATFQLGEQSEGRTLLEFAERFARRHDIPALPAVTALFIREEQHHAAQLRVFMQANGIPLKQTNWTDSIFRRIRKLAGYEAAVTILVTAEMIGFVYYRALARATGSRALKSICRQMCADESVHLRYETQLLMTLRGERGWVTRRLVDGAHRMLVSAAALVVFYDHRRVLRHVGYDVRGFHADCRAIHRMVMRHGTYRPRQRDVSGSLPP
jgi:ribonucleotide reductase beta subunit family protein with ferritin-like domain